MDTSQSANSTMDEPVASTSTSMADAGVSMPTTSACRLQQKIDIVQQVLTLLELTMASGKYAHEMSVAGTQKQIESLERTIQVLKTKITNSETEFSRLSRDVGGEINRYCALDNILRTVEESRTENDVKILLPDISKIDKYFQLYTTNRSHEWRRIKKELQRLNSESLDENHVVRDITFRVTIRNRVLNGLQSARVNELAALINESRGKSMNSGVNRIYNSNAVPEYSVKYLKVTWNQKNLVAAETVTSNTIKIVQDAFHDEGEVVKIQVVEREETIPAINHFQNTSMQIQHPPQSCQDSARVFTDSSPNSVLVYCIGKPNGTGQTLESQSAVTTLLNNNIAPQNEEIQIVKEVTRSTKIKIVGAEGNLDITHDIGPCAVAEQNQELLFENGDSRSAACQDSDLNVEHVRNNLPSRNLNSVLRNVEAEDHAYCRTITSTENSLTSTKNANAVCAPVKTYASPHPISGSGGILNNLRQASGQDVINREIYHSFVNEPSSKVSTSTEIVPDTVTLSSVDNNIINPEVGRSFVGEQDIKPVVPEGLKKTDKASIDAFKAADRFASSEIRKLLAVTLTLRKHRPVEPNPQATSAFENGNLYDEINAFNFSTEDSSSMPLTATNASISTPIEVEGIVDTSVALSPSNLQPNCDDEEKLDGISLKIDLIRECNGHGIFSLNDLQKELLPVLIDGRDVICRADKGSGKSTAIALSALQKVNTDVLSPQVLVATASFACAERIAEMINNLGKKLKVICRNADEQTAGSSSSSSSYMAFSSTPKSHVLVGVSTSLLQLLMSQKFQNQTVTCLMLDNLDRILAQGLKPTILKVLYALNASTQVVVMTSSLTANVEEFRKNLRNPVSVIQPENTAVDVFPVPVMGSKKPFGTIISRTEGLDSTAVCIRQSSLILPRTEGTDKRSSTNAQTLEYEQELSISLSPPSSADTVMVLEDDVFSSGSTGSESNATGDSESDVESSGSAFSEIEDNLRSITVSRRSSEEIETMICANEIFDGDDEIMTVIPEYIYQSLGVPMLSDFSNASRCTKDEDGVGASHFYVVLNEDTLKIETLSLLDIEDEKTVIFCNSIEKVEWLSSQLRQRQLWPQTMHEDMNRNEWSVNLRNFLRGKLCKLLVATNFLAELTTHEASLVINYDFPLPARNYVSRAAFAERSIGLPQADICGSIHPMVISFITEDNLKDIQDLKSAFNLKIRPMSDNSSSNT